MPTRPRLSSSLGIYHVVYRGINKQRIFEDSEDYEKFLSILRKYQPICGYRLVAYCLMSNHIHLLIKPGEIPLPRVCQQSVAASYCDTIYSSKSCESCNLQSSKEVQIQQLPWIF